MKQDVGEGDAAVLDRQGEALVAGEAAAMARPASGMAIWPTTVKTSSTDAEAGERVAGEALRRPRRPRAFLANIGTKARLKAPSAKKRRNMLGSVKAIRKACATGPVPR